MRLSNEDIINLKVKLQNSLKHYSKIRAKVSFESYFDFISVTIENYDNILYMFYTHDKEKLARYKIDHPRIDVNSDYYILFSNQSSQTICVEAKNIDFDYLECAFWWFITNDYDSYS